MKQKIQLTSVLLFLTLILDAQVSTTKYELSDDSLQQIIANYEMPTINVLGQKPRLLSDVPGSATYIPAQSIQSLQALSGNEVFRTVTGLHVVDEEGIGLRANIGIRGLDPDRSSKVLILEDGIPVALNPFGEPQLYYTPTMDRMEAVEVLKGSGQILFGPQTIGGVINYITADPPKESSGNIKLRGGQGGFFSGLIGYGNTIGNTGFQINYLRKQADEIGPTHFRINDLSGKIKFKVSKHSNVGIKLGIYDEISNSTYVGITQAMYDKGGQDFVQIAPDDQLGVRRVSLSMTHEYRPNHLFNLKTTAFAYTTTRNWQRQDFSYAPTSNMTGTIWGDTSINEGAIYMRNQNGHRNRQFEVAGIEPRFTKRYALGNIHNKLEGGIRFMFERAFEQRVNGKKADAASGTLVNDEIRTGKAFSTFLQNRFALTDALSFTAGLRYEVYEYERDILRLSELDTSIVSSNLISQIIPGIGFNYNINQQISFFGGIHRGFAPPRIKDAISNSGEVYQLDPELSWNSEIGFRSDFGEVLKLEMTAFYMDFSNQIIPVSESSGGTGSGVVNGGSTLHKGLEIGAEIAFDKFLPADYSLNFIVNTTFLKAYYNKDRFKQNEGEWVNIKDKRTPYTPETLISSSILFSTPSGILLRFTGTYTGNQYTDELNTREATNNGRIGFLEDYFLMDGTLQYKLKKFQTTLSLSIKNLTDERYIATRRPQGIRVGLPRYISFGIDKKF